MRSLMDGPATASRLASAHDLPRANNENYPEHPHWVCTLSHIKGWSWQVNRFMVLVMKF